MKKVKTDIMGNMYNILFLENADEKEKYPHICGNMGITLTSSKTILIDAEMTNYTEEEGGMYDNNIPYINETLRHEIVHAYLNECGLKSQTFGVSCWTRNEEMVDWIAIIAPRMFDTFKSLNIL